MKRRDFLRALGAAGLLAATRGFAAEGEGGRLVSVFGQLPAPARVRRVFAAGAPASVLTAVLAPDRLLGWPWKLSAEALDTLPAPLRGLPLLGRLAGRGSTVSSETLLNLKPDLILDVGTIDDTYLSIARRVAEQTGIPYVLVGGRLADSARQLREVGALLGVPARAEPLAAYAEGTLARAARQRAAIPAGQRPRIYYARGGEGLETGLDGSINMEAIDVAGGYNVVAAAGRGGIVTVSLEQVLGWAPQVVLTQDPTLARRLLADPLWRAVPAIRDRRVLCAPALPFGWLDVPPSVNRLIGVRWLLAHLHGTPDTALSRDADEFCRLFYGHGFSGWPGGHPAGVAQ
jgi:iron complex transport system substrate-binding protein